MKILSIIEATTVTGPAKNLLNFCRLVRSAEFQANGTPSVEVSIVTFHRQDVSEPRAVATGSFQSSCALDPIATAPGSDTFGDAQPNPFVSTAREMGITVDVINERFRFDPSIVNQLRDIIARRAPDIIQTHMIKSHFLVKFAGLGRKYPWIAYHHGYTTTDLKMKFYNRLNRWSLPSAARVITVCDAFAKQLAGAGVRPECISVRHNSVVAPRKTSDAEVSAIQTKFGIADDESVILSVGRFSQEKGHADLIRAVASLRKLTTHKFKLVLVGDGPERDQLESLANTLGLTDQVVFVGHVSDVAPYYGIADVLALPSHSEGSPNVLLEAMAAGLPIVATNVGGVPEIASSEKDALLVAPREPQVFATALHRVLTEPELANQLQTNAIDRAAEFSPESYARSLIQIYRELVTEPRALTTGSEAQPDFENHS